MRKRSSGLHADTQQEYMELSELTMKTTGIFYNETNQIYFPEADETKCKQSSQSNIYKNFDFNPENKAFQEQISEINKTNKFVQNKITVVLVDNVIQFRQKCDNQYFQKHSKVEQNEQFERIIDLIIIPDQLNSTIQKLWILKKQKIYNSLLLQTYLKKANSIFILCQQVDHSQHNCYCGVDFTNNKSQQIKYKQFCYKNLIQTFEQMLQSASQ